MEFLLHPYTLDFASLIEVRFSSVRSNKLERVFTELESQALRERLGESFAALIIDMCQQI